MTYKKKRPRKARASRGSWGGVAQVFGGFLAVPGWWYGLGHEGWICSLFFQVMSFLQWHVERSYLGFHLVSLLTCFYFGVSFGNVSRRGINELEKDYMLFYTFLNSNMFGFPCPLLNENDQIWPIFFKWGSNHQRISPFETDVAPGSLACTPVGRCFFFLWEGLLQGLYDIWYLSFRKCTSSPRISGT